MPLSQDRVWVAMLGVQLIDKNSLAAYVRRTRRRLTRGRWRTARESITKLSPMSKTCRPLMANTIPVVFELSLIHVRLTNDGALNEVLS
jgi:hypothetical protein